MFYFNNQENNEKAKFKMFVVTSQQWRDFHFTPFKILIFLWSHIGARALNIWAAINFLLISINFITEAHKLRRVEIHIWPNIYIRTSQGRFTSLPVPFEVILIIFSNTLHSAFIFFDSRQTKGKFVQTKKLHQRLISLFTQKGRWKWNWWKY